MTDGTVTISTASLRRLGIVCALTIVAVGLLYVGMQQRDRVGGMFAGTIASQIASDRYQVVFLTGGQIFFGRLTSRGDMLLLSDVFYLQTAPDAASGEPGTLVKRGNELFGPTEPLVIPKEQLIFMENLRGDSQVVQGIQRFRSGETAPPATSRPALPTRPSPSPTR